MTEVRPCIDITKTGIGPDFVEPLLGMSARRGRMEFEIESIGRGTAWGGGEARLNHVRRLVGEGEYPFLDVPNVGGTAVC